MRRARRLTRGVTLAAALCAATAARADFAAAVSPPRFEFDVQAGRTERQVLEISHAGTAPGRYRLYTLDWHMTADGSMSFSDALLPDSCRPWVALERRELTLQPGTRLRYRFEVSPPAGTAPVECRFALMLESVDDGAAGGAAPIATGGRIGVIVYARVGGVAPRLRIESTRVARIDGHDVPAVVMHNDGQATGRLAGFVSGRDAHGRVFELSPAGLPVLPGMTRLVALLPEPPQDRAGAAAPVIDAWPLHVEGSLQTQGVKGAALPLKQSYSPP